MGQRIFLAAVMIRRLGHVDHELKELMFKNGEAHIVFSWRSFEVPGTTVKIDKAFLSPGDRRSDFIYDSVIDDPNLERSSDASNRKPTWQLHAMKRDQSRLN